MSLEVFSFKSISEMVFIGIFKILNHSCVAKINLTRSQYITL